MVKFSVIIQLFNILLTQTPVVCSGKQRKWLFLWFLVFNRLKESGVGGGGVLLLWRKWEPVSWTFHNIRHNYEWINWTVNAGCGIRGIKHHRPCCYTEMFLFWVVTLLCFIPYVTDRWREFVRPAASWSWNRVASNTHVPAHTRTRCNYCWIKVTWAAEDMLFTSGRGTEEKKSLYNKTRTHTHIQNLISLITKKCTR